MGNKNKKNALIEMGNVVDEQAMGEGSKYGYQCEIKSFTTFVKEKYNKSILHWDEVTLALLTDYETWLHRQTIMHKITHEMVFMEDNTVIGKMMKIYTILKYAERKELIDLQATRIFKLKDKKSKKDKIEENQIYLTDEELTTILKLDLEGDTAKVRDLFCFQNEVGQRYEDINGICPKIIKGNKVEIIQKKTSKRVTPPITETAREILDKYNGRLPTIRLQVANKLLKQIAKQAGITRKVSACEMRNGKQYRYEVEGWQLVGTHTARRSFVSNGLKTNDSSVLKKITGHSTTSAFERYNRLNSEDAADIVINNNIKIEQPQQSQSVPVTSASTISPTIDYIEKNIREKIQLENKVEEQSKLIEQQEREGRVLKKELQDYQETFSTAEYIDKIGDLTLMAEQDSIYLYHEKP